MCSSVGDAVCNLASAYIKEKTKLDDTLDVVGCHGVGGTLGTLLTATFASKAVNSSGADGLLYGSAELLKAHLIGTLCIFILSVVGTYVAFKIADSLFGMRVTEQEEKEGLDKSQHDEAITSSSTIDSKSHTTSNGSKEHTQVAA